MAAPRIQMAEELLRAFSATMRSLQLYSKGHPIIMRNIGALSTAIQLLHAMQSSIVARRPCIRNFENKLRPMTPPRAVIVLIWSSRR